MPFYELVNICRRDRVVLIQDLIYGSEKKKIEIQHGKVRTLQCQLLHSVIIIQSKEHIVGDLFNFVLQRCHLDMD